MNDLDIITLAENLVLPENILSKAIDLIEERIITLKDICEHKKAATRSGCDCHYCRIIQVYVKAKIRYDKMVKIPTDWNSLGPIGAANRELFRMRSERLRLTTIAKEEAKSAQYRLVNNHLVLNQ